MKTVWSRAADQDLARIYAFLELRSFPAARRLLRRLFKAIDSLADNPRMGSVADVEMAREYRQLVVDHYKIFYYIADKRLVIVRLWDTRQDPTKFFIPRTR